MPGAHEWFGDAPTINVRNYGVMGRGDASDGAALQQLIDDMQGGPGILDVPPGDYGIAEPLVLPDGVYIRSQRPGFGYLATSLPRWTTRFRALSDVPSIITSDPSKRLGNAGVQGIDLDGAGRASRGIDWHEAGWSVIRDMHMNNFLDQFIKIDDGAANVIDNFLGVNGLRRPIAERIARAERVGSIELGGADHMLGGKIQTGGGYFPEQGTTGDMLNCAYYIKGGSIFGTQLVGEFSETGFYFDRTATGNRLSLCRSDKGAGDGFVIEGRDNVFSSCHSANMALHAHDVFAGFRASYYGQGNLFTGCKVHALSSYTQNLPKYAFADHFTGGPTYRRNEWDATCSGAYATAMFYTVDHEGSAPVIAPHPKRHPANSAVLDVTNSGAQILNGYTEPTTITAMTGGVNGQTVRLFTTNEHVTVDHNGHVSRRGSIYTSTGQPLKLAPNVAYAFTMISGVWCPDF